MTPTTTRSRRRAVATFCGLIAATAFAILLLGTGTASAGPGVPVVLDVNTKIATCQVYASLETTAGFQEQTFIGAGQLTSTTTDPEGVFAQISWEDCEFGSRVHGELRVAGLLVAAGSNRLPAPVIFLDTSDDGGFCFPFCLRNTGGDDPLDEPSGDYTARLKVRANPACPAFGSLFLVRLEDLSGDFAFWGASKAKSTGRFNLVQPANLDDGLLATATLDHLNCPAGARVRIAYRLDGVFYGGGFSTGGIQLMAGDDCLCP
ncbi:MAG: hypothetical protein WEB00_03985 [Dehalococcoidia bacterium]